MRSFVVYFKDLPSWEDISDFVASTGGVWVQSESNDPSRICPPHVFYSKDSGRVLVYCNDPKVYLNEIDYPRIIRILGGLPQSMFEIAIGHEQGGANGDCLALTVARLMLMRWTGAIAWLDDELYSLGESAALYSSE